jgi:hypothetical protein
MKRIMAVVAGTVFAVGVCGVNAVAQETEQTALSINGEALNVALSGVVEVEASWSEQGDVEESDLSLATVEIGLEAEGNEWVSGGLLLLYEEDDTEDVTVDEGFITLANADETPFFLTAGKLYVPFGMFESAMVSDPLVLELGETRESAALIGFCNDWVELSAGTFNGGIDEEEDDQIDSFVAAINVMLCKAVTLGAYWMSDIGESDTLEEMLAEAMEPEPAAEGEVIVEPPAYEEVAGAGFHCSVCLGAWTLYGEVLGALDDFNSGLLGAGEQAPAAWNTELIYCPHDAWCVAARYEGSDAFPEAPEEQYGVTISRAIGECAVCALEYLHGAFEGEVEDRNTATLQIAMEF